MNSIDLAAVAYRYAEEHYGDKDTRFDVIVECMTKQEIADELTAAGVKSEKSAIAWAKRRAGLHHEQELNQAWDGPESVKSSSKYRPECDPAGDHDHQPYTDADAYDPMDDFNYVGSRHHY